MSAMIYQVGKDRRAVLKLLTSSCVMSLSVGCVSALEETEKSLFPSDTQPLRDFSSEPFDVRVVDRRKFPEAFIPADVTHAYDYPSGSLVVDTHLRQMFLIETKTMARRYVIAVGDAGHSWSGSAIIGRKSKWPAWFPTRSMREKTPDLPRRVEPGADNPLGARALYLFQGDLDTLFRIHGTSEPWTIGTQASSGCIRMFNEDAIELYDRVKVGTPVVVI